MLRRDDGQILPGLLVLLLASFALGVMALQVGKASVLRSEAQTAADAAALAGAREIKRQLQLQWQRYQTTDVSLIDRGAVLAAMDRYARLNGGIVSWREINGVDVKVKVRTEQELGENARPIDRAEEKGGAKARARLGLTIGGGLGGGGGGSIGAIPEGGGGTPRISATEWKTLDRQIEHPPQCDDVVKLGHVLQDAGFQVAENRYFPPLDLDVHEDGSYHYRCDAPGSGALDVNFGGAGDLDPQEVAAVDPVIEPLNDLGFRTIWRAAGHYDHLHVDIGRSGPIGAGSGGSDGGGFTGPLEDSRLDVRLIDWEAPVAPFYGLGGAPPTGNLGRPDPKVAAVICEIAGAAGPRYLLAAFEAAIVESGVQNLNYGDRDSLGPFQQRPSVGAWGTAAQILDPRHATRAFVDAAIAEDRRNPGQPVGLLVANVQRPAEQYRGRYAQREGDARVLIERFCR